MGQTNEICVEYSFGGADMCNFELWQETDNCFWSLCKDKLIVSQLRVV